MKPADDKASALLRRAHASNARAIIATRCLKCGEAAAKPLAWFKRRDLKCTACDGRFDAGPIIDSLDALLKARGREIERLQILARRRGEAVD